MILLKIFLVGVGGFVGAILRYQVSQWIHHFSKSDLPLPTLCVNILGSFLLGLLSGFDLAEFWVLLCGTGVLGAFTTFSTFKLEAIQLHLKQKWKNLAIYIITSYSAGIGLAYAGFNFAQWLSS
jgi:fluoride exporter